MLLMLFEVKKSCLTARLGYKRHFLTFHISRHTSLKNGDLKKLNFTHGGRQKRAKKVSRII